MSEQHQKLTSEGWEFHLVDDTLYITDEATGQHQVALSAKAAYDLLEYLYLHNAELDEAAHPQEPTRRLGGTE